MDESKPPGIRIAQIYVAQALFGHVEHAFSMPSNTPVGEIPTQINVKVGESPADKVGFCSLTVRSDPEAKTLYRFSVEMVLLAEVGPEPNMELPVYLTRSGPPTLYPFIREVVASLSSKGRFGTLWLPPMNFATISEKILKERAEKAEATAVAD